MFGLGFWEIAVVVLLAVTLFPPKEIPKLARSIAQAYGTVRRTAEDFRSQIMDDEELRAPLDEVRSAYNDARWQVSKVQQDAREQLRKAESEARMAVSSTVAPAIASGEHEEADETDEHDEHDGHDEHDEHDETGGHDEADKGERVGYTGAPLADEEPDPRFADDPFEEDDEEDEDEDGEADPFAEPAAKADAPARPRIPGPPPVGGKGKSQAV